MPILIGTWIIALFGLALVAVGLFQFVAAVRSTGRRETNIQYLAGVISIILGVVLFLSPGTALSGLILIVTALLLADGLSGLYGAYAQPAPERWWNLFNGIFAICLGLLIWYLVSVDLGTAAVGIVVGLHLLVQGWTMFLLREGDADFMPLSFDPREHPDVSLGLEPSDVIREVRETIDPADATGPAENVTTCLTFLAIFFAIHALRTDATWSFIGLIAPFAAVVGDAVVAIVIGAVIVLPIRALWRKVTRPAERAGWERFIFLREHDRSPLIGERVLRFWLQCRMTAAVETRRIRYSLNFAFWQVMRIGLPATAVLIAVNSIWGFSWYFNSENWAAGIYQTIAAGRVDVWRVRMTAEAEKQATLAGVPADRTFEIKPEGISDTEDFSFVVIGDTGEGDPSQTSLRAQLIAASSRENVKFLVLSSDIIYPDGRMKDYERNFYLPFMGFRKPIYAIPGNHDWYDANEGFNANFLDRESAIAALRGRLAEDLKTDLITTDTRFDEITAEAARLRSYYGVQNGLQRGPYFEMHTAGFSLIGVDTGILRRIDDRQKAWLEAALTKAGSNFKVVIMGHPLFVAGRYLGQRDADIGAITEMLQRHNVDVVMAGDTHDFEFYKQQVPAQDGTICETFNFVNGGGGAYLSVGTALAFPPDPDAADYAFYPRTDQLREKLLAETPLWRMPFYYWMEWFGGYPFDSEMVSGAFDFNSAPFFQSFLEVRVERSTGSVRMILHGVQGPLRWRDIETGGGARPMDKSEDDPVEFVKPLSTGLKP